jgi:hypothetical protein
MGNLFGKLWDKFSMKEARILLLGLDAAGKTTILCMFIFPLLSPLSSPSILSLLLLI